MKIKKIVPTLKPVVPIKGRAEDIAVFEFSPDKQYVVVFGDWYSVEMATEIIKLIQKKDNIAFLLGNLPDVFEKESK